MEKKEKSKKEMTEWEVSDETKLGRIAVLSRQ